MAWEGGRGREKKEKEEKESKKITQQQHNHFLLLAVCWCLGSSLTSILNSTLLSIPNILRSAVIRDNDDVGGREGLLVDGDGVAARAAAAAQGGCSAVLERRGARTL